MGNTPWHPAPAWTLSFLRPPLHRLTFAKSGSAQCTYHRPQWFLLYDLLPQVGGRQVSLATDNIPQCMRDATIAVEDANFYAHPGVDPVGIIRALRWIESIPMDQSLAHEATQIAGSRRLRGADAVYVALAVMRRVPLITLDAEMLERARGVADVFTPEQWLQKR